MNKNHLLIFAFIFLFLCAGCLQQTRKETIEPIRIIGKESYISIQKAIDNATTDDTIILSNGIYYEHLIINKTVNIRGTNANNTIIDGMNHHPIILITADNVVLENIKIQNGSFQPTDAAVLINANSTLIHRLIVENTSNGIYLTKNSKNTHINHSLIRNCVSGVHIRESTHNQVINTTFTQNTGFGVYLDFYANHNQITGNIITDNEIGMRIKTAVYNIVSKNYVIKNNKQGIYLCCSAHNNILYQNYFIDNNENAQDHYANKWSYQKKGNYWSDYPTQHPDAVDADQDGIWDQAYIIKNGNNTDAYPLVTYPQR